VYEDREHNEGIQTDEAAQEHEWHELLIHPASGGNQRTSRERRHEQHGGKV
jgi:hypothetical protein